MHLDFCRLLRKHSVLRFMTVSLKYEDGTGGCDGCLNLYDQGTNSKTDNNGLQPIAALLELIYSDPAFQLQKLSQWRLLFLTSESQVKIFGRLLHFLQLTTVVW